MTPMLQIDPAAAMPVIEQIRLQITRLVVAGQLPVGARLPPIRQLAADLGLARGTVAKAYELLTGDGVVATNGRHGTVVLEAEKAPPRIQHRELAAAAETLVITARQLGATRSDTLGALRAAWARFE